MNSSPQSRIPESFAILHDILRNVNIDILEWDLEKDTITWGAELFDDFNKKSRNTLTVKEFTENVHPDYVGQLTQQLEEARTKKENFIAEFSFNSFEGNLEYFRVYAHFLDGKYFGLSWNVTNLEKDKIRFEAIYTGLIKIGGQSFFSDISKFLAKNFNAEFVFIAKYLDDSSELETLSFVHKNKILNNFSISADNFPCNKVFENGIQVFSGKEVGIIPARYRKKKNLKSCIAVPLMGGDGKPLGLMVLLFKSLIENPDEFEYLLSIFASRASAELHQYMSLDVVQQSEKHFREVFENASMPVFLMDPSSMILTCNTTFEKVLGYSLDDMKTFSLEDFIHPSDLIPPEIFFPSVLNAGAEGFRMESRLRHKQGHYLWTEAYISAVVDRADQLLYVIVMVQDITEKKHTQDALIESERKLLEAQKFAGLGRWDWDIENDESTWSDTVYDILEIDRKIERLDRKVIVSLFPPEFRLRYLEALDRLINEDEWNVKPRMITPNGKIKYLDILGKIEKNSKGKPIRAVGTVQDITTLQMAKLELEKKSHDLILINDINSIINEPGKLENVYVRLSHWFFSQFNYTGFVISYPDENKKVFEIDYVGFTEPITKILGDDIKQDFKPLTLSYRKDGSLSKILQDKLPRFENLEYLKKTVNLRSILNAGNWLKEDIVKAIQNTAVTKYLTHLSIFPLVADDKVWAFIHLFGTEILSQEDIGRIKTISQQTAGIIRRKRAVDGLMIHREKLIQLSRRLFGVQEEERSRLALELHDDLGQSLTAMKINVSKAISKLKGSIDETVMEKLTDTIDMIDSSEESIRDISLMLRPSMLDELGLMASLEWYIGQYRKRNEIRVKLKYLIPDSILNSDQQTVLYRITQEALTNISRHANANNIVISIDQDEEGIIAKIRDDGIGFDYKAVSETKAHKESAGLVGMKERIQLVNGKIYINTKPGDGTEIRITIPVEE